MVLLTAVLTTVLAVPVPAQAAAEPDLVRNLQWQIPALQLTEVHKRSTGAGMVVAVVDSGVDPQHQDLTGQLVQGPDTSNTDVDGRGTGLAGLIAGHGHDVGRDKGVLGVAPDAKILPAAFAPVPFENGDPDRMASSIELAMNRGAKIICLGRGVSPSERLDFAIEVAVDKGILIVAADTAPWPASYPGVLSALPADRAGIVRSPAASGRTTGLAVPGVDLMTTDRAGGYRIGDSSSAAAILAGAAAVLWSANQQATAAQITDVLRKTATNREGISSLNLMAALNAGVPKPSPSAKASAATPKPTASKALAFNDPLVHSRDWRRWLVVLPLIGFMVALATWAYFAAKRREVPTASK